MKNCGGMSIESLFRRNGKQPVADLEKVALGRGN